MKEMILHLANYFFYTFHTVLILFNLLGWIYPRTRRLNLITLLATFASWFLLGIWFGWGYCFLTDWHYAVLEALGETNLPSSYIAHLVEKISGWAPNGDLVNTLTIGLAIAAIVASLWVNFKSRR